MMVLVLLRLRPANRNIVLGVAMSVGGAAFAIATAPYVPKTSLWWTLPLLSAQPVVFWLWARATFDDEFVLKRWHGGLWAAVIAIGFASSLSWTIWPAFSRGGARMLSWIAVVLAVLAMVQTISTWRDDLVARRRLLRVAVLLINLGFIALVAGPSLLPLPPAGTVVPGPVGSGSFVIALTLFILAMLASLNLFSLHGSLAALPAAASADAARPEVNRGETRAAIDPLLLRRLDRLMTTDRIYRQEGLYIGALAAKLDVPEYRLRQAINEGLGYKNFNAFLNRYRIDEAKAALSDPTQREVPILTIAIDAGFQSIGPFNRAFKAATGMTPTDFRRGALDAAAVSPVRPP